MDIAIAVAALLAVLFLVARRVPGRLILITALVAVAMSLIVVWVERGALLP